MKTPMLLLAAVALLGCSTTVVGAPTVLRCSDLCEVNGGMSHMTTERAMMWTIAFAKYGRYDVDCVCSNGLHKEWREKNYDADSTTPAGK